MPKFLFIFRGGGYASKTDTISPTEVEAHLAKWQAWSKDLHAGGQLAGAHPLGHPPAGATLRGRDKTVTDGPYAESKDLVSGILIVEAATLDAATELARGCPIFEFDGSVEVRQVMDVPGPPPK